MADRALAQCDVLRCTDPVHRVIRVSPPDRILLQSRVCYEHSEAIDRGDRWMWHHGGASGGVGQRSAIAMGADLPPVVTNASLSSGHFSNLGGTELVRLELQHGDGAVSDVEFELDPEVARRLALWFGPRAPQLSEEQGNDDKPPKAEG